MDLKRVEHLLSTLNTHVCWMKAVLVSPVPACQRQAKQTRTAEPRGTHRTDRQSLPSAFRSGQLTSGHFQCHVWIIHVLCSLLLSSTSYQNTNCCLQICTTPNSCLPRLDCHLPYGVTYSGSLRVESTHTNI